jgi:hypothetical protein
LRPIQKPYEDIADYSTVDKYNMIRERRRNRSDNKFAQRFPMIKGGRSEVPEEYTFTSTVLKPLISIDLPRNKLDKSLPLIDQEDKG